MHLPTTASTHGAKNTMDSNCFHKALDSCAISTGQRAWSVAQSDRNGATAAASARATLHSVTFVLSIPSRTDANLDTRLQRLAARRPTNNLLRAHRCPQMTLLTTARYQSVPLGTSPSRNGISRCSSSFAGPPRCCRRRTNSVGNELPP